MVVIREFYFHWAFLLIILCLYSGLHESVLVPGTGLVTALVPRRAAEERRRDARMG